jgi:uncharacterized cupredoxin-like copper-binding protein
MMNKNILIKKILTIFIFAVLFASNASSTAWAHSDPKKPVAKKTVIEEKTFGREGDPKKITRTIQVDMTDAMRYSPTQITVTRGDTVRFVVKNSGKVMHEMVLGTMAELKQHSELMKKHPGMEHAESYMAHVQPGKTEQMVWQFTQTGEFYYGCLVPGHFEAGMVGKIIVN